MKFSAEQWKEVLGQVQVLKTYYARLSERERYIVMGIAAGSVLFLMLLIYSAFGVTTSSMAGRIDEARKGLKRIEELRGRFVQTERQVHDYENMIRRTPLDFQLGTHLDGIAKKNGVTIDSLREKPAPSNELYKETQVSVSVQHITLRTLINLLFEIENSSVLLRVTSLQVKPNFQDPTQLSANFVVSTFQLAKGS